MKSFRLLSNWNGDGVRLFNLRRFLEMRNFDLRKENVRIVIHDDGNWDFFAHPKEEPKPEPEPSESMQTATKAAIAIEDEEVKKEVKKLVDEKIPMCKKCKTKHWRFHKCPVKEE